VTERTQPPFCYELRHRRLAAAALRALQRACADRAEPGPLLANGVPEELLDPLDVIEIPEARDRDA
jgi:hypothetical protein